MKEAYDAGSREVAVYARLNRSMLMSESVAAKLNCKTRVAGSKLKRISVEVLLFLCNVKQYCAVLDLQYVNFHSIICLS